MSTVDIFHVSSSDDETTEDVVNANVDPPRNVLPVPRPERPAAQPTRRDSPVRRDDAPPVQPDYTEVLESLREQIATKARKFERAMDDLKRRHAEQLALLKHNNVTQEQSLASSYDLEFRNIVWSVTLRRLGRGMFSEEIGPLLEQRLSEEEFQLEKEILELQQRYDDEIAHLRAQSHRRKKRSSRRKHHIQSPLDPQRIAQMVCDALSDYDRDIGPDVNETMVGEMMRRLKRETEVMQHHRQTVSPGHRAYRAPRERLERPRGPVAAPPPPPPAKDDFSGVTRHEVASAKLIKSVAKTDRFLRELRGKKWLDV